MSYEVQPVLPFVQFGPKASYVGVVTSLPFEALYEVTLTTRGERDRASGAIQRDSAGRIRREYRILHAGRQEPLDLVVVADFAAHSLVVLDTATRTAVNFKDFGAPGGGPPQGGWAFQGAWSPEVGAEEKAIEGLLCRKVARLGWPLGTSLEVGEAGEIWISDEIRYSVSERVTDPGGEYTWRLYSIRRTAPPESLFAIPAGYTVFSRSKLDPGG